MRKLWLVLSVVLMALVSGALFASASKAATLPKVVELGTHPIGSINNAMGGGLAKVASMHSGMKVVTRPTSGPPAWVPLMSKTGSPDAGLIDAYAAWQAYT